MPDFAADRAAASWWARELLESDPGSWVIFDTETTGLRDAEILEVGLLTSEGLEVNARVCPDLAIINLTRIPEDATAIHGITDAMVAPGVAPTLEEMLPAMADLMHGWRVIVYNVAYDFEILQGCLRRRWDRERAAVWLNACAWECAMKQYARFVGEWDYRRSPYRWHKLQGGDHSAIGDCRATLGVIKRMAGGN